LQGSGLHNVLS